eukprot:TRINITY_DN35970_c0_g1_i1.p1 TRINITY_DN35970_c0_g1~~TRINITY_DN35970_c0_g1_i1.p1  ORF type:complete len:164 (+),score=26.84 TRINITY_DN35970_c0_g1_i1:128-619(+)
MALRSFASHAAVTLRVRCIPTLERHLVMPLSRAFSAAPAGKHYLKSHEWVEIDGEVGTVGISDFAQSELGEVVYVELPEVGATLEKGATFGVVESVKAASDVYSPVTGEVVEANTELSSNPGLVNSGAFTEGWMLKVKLTKPDEVSELLDESAYSAHVEASAH